jgi:hypothetical protein
VPRTIGDSLAVRNNKKSLASTLKTLPGALLAALGTALIGALVAYFAPGALDRLTGEDRLQVRLETNPATIDTFSSLSHYALVPRGQRVSGNPGEGCAGFYPWISDFGGVPAGETNFRVIAQGGGDQTLISGIRARVIERNPPLSGTGFECPTQAGLKVRTVALDLDEPNPTGQVVEYEAGEVLEKGKGVTFTVSEDETEVFDITATTEECYCEWILELVTTQDGDQDHRRSGGRKSLGDHCVAGITEHPFRDTGNASVLPLGPLRVELVDFWGLARYGVPS